MACTAIGAEVGSVNCCWMARIYVVIPVNANDTDSAASALSAVSMASTTCDMDSESDWTDSGSTDCSVASLACTREPS